MQTYGWYPTTRPTPFVALMPGIDPKPEVILMPGGDGVCQLQELPVADLELRQDLPVRVSWSAECGAYVAYEERQGLWFGLGSSPQRALADLGEVLVEVYRELAGDAGVLAAPLQRQLAAVQQIVIPCRSK